MTLAIHAFATGLLLLVAHLGMEKMGLYEGKTKKQKFWLNFPVYFVLVLCLNLIWPWPS